MSKLKGKVQPLHDRIFVSEMHFDMEVSLGGIHLLSDNGKSTGIHPRWAKVWAIGPEQKEVKVDEWVLVEHGRWTRTIEYENEDGSITELRVVDNNAVMMSTDEKPAGTMRSAPVGAGSNVNFNIPGA
jgi:co-chaperonin GroES (HSP10)